MNYWPVLLFFLFAILSCQEQGFEKMNCNKDVRSFDFGDSLSVRASAIVSNLKLVDKVEAEVRQRLILSYTSEFENEIPYSTEFCKQFNAIVDFLNKFDRERRPDSGLDENTREKAALLYDEYSKRLIELLLSNLEETSSTEDKEASKPEVAIKKDTSPEVKKEEDARGAMQSVTLSGRIRNQKDGDVVVIYRDTTKLGETQSSGRFSVSIQAPLMETIFLDFESQLCGVESISVLVNTINRAGIAVTLPCE